MIDRRVRLAGDQLIEEALAKRADLFAPTIPHPTLGSLKAQKTKELGGLPSPTAQAMVPKVLSTPSSTLR